MSYLSTRTEFEQSLLHFYNESLQCQTEFGWSWETQRSLNHAYLKKTSVFITNTRPAPYLEEENKDVEDPQDPTIAIHEQIDTIYVEYHIVYSTSYQVPVLYFKATYDDGSPLSLNELYEQIIPKIYHGEVVISQNEHPLLNSPFWYIHPCDTRKLMDTIQFDRLDYIKTWLSFNGPVFKCNISKEMFLT